jgi:hypothetical protein
VADQPWLPPKFKAFSAIVAAESALFAKIMDLLKSWASRLRTAVFGPSWHAGGPTLHMPDPFGIRSTSSWFDEQLNEGVLIEVKEIFDFASHDIADDTPDGLYRANQAVLQSKNRLSRVPDSVFNAVRAQTLKATTEGWSIDELASEIDQVLADADADRWKNRARTIARTEAVAAYNAGTYSGFQSYAQSVPGPWEKVWLETHDHRTRLTHREGEQGFGGQRVPLTAMFRHGDVEMPYPGWPLAPAEEVINCRCSILLAREGEIIDFSNRHYRGNA